MTQIATVERILDDTHAEISVPRKSACGHDCEECAGCGVSGVSVYVKALNTVGARPGQKVGIESKSSAVYKAAMLVYLLPITLVVLGYLLAYLAGAAEGLCVASAFVGLLVGAAIVVLSQRLKKNHENDISFDIVQLRETGEKA